MEGKEAPDRAGGVHNPLGSGMRPGPRSLDPISTAQVRLDYLNPSTRGESRIKRSLPRAKIYETKSIGVWCKAFSDRQA